MSVSLKMQGKNKLQPNIQPRNQLLSLADCSFIQRAGNILINNATG
jgi:hypothetical protein